MPSVLNSQHPILNLKNPSSIRLAVIETDLNVSGHLCTVFHIMLEDDINHFSLIRFIQDFKELDELLVQHFPKLRIPLPKKIIDQPSKKSSLFASLKKKKKKSNAQLLEHYLSRCISARIGSSSLFRDFLSVQRDEDRVISKKIVCQLVAQHHQVVTQIVETNQQLNDEIDQFITHHYLKRKRTSTTSSTLKQQQQKRFMLAESSTLPPSPPPSSSHISMTEFPEYRHDSGLSSCSSSHSNLLLVDQKKENNYSHDTINNYQLIKVLGKGATGKVILVRDQNSHRLYALKTMTKSWSITKREVEHIRMERDILATLSSIHHPFLIRLHSAFQDPQNLYLVLDYHAGADLATLLQRYICFPPEQCRLYAAEIVMGLQELHRHAILYRDLKPENVLLAADGHLVLTDFGLSKMFDERQAKYEHRTTTFCGTPEYLAPEIILQDEEYSYAADFWSLGTMLYEMLTGVTPFAAETPEDMYDRVLYDDLVFPRRFDPEAQDLISGLLERNPMHRLGAGYGGVFELRSHAYFANHLNWKDVHAKRIQPAYVPLRTSETDLSHFDPDFLNMSTHIKEENDEAVMLRQRWLPDSCPAGLEKHAFRGYSYLDDEEQSSIMYESEISFFSSEFMYYNNEEDVQQLDDNESLLIEDYYNFYSHPSTSSFKEDTVLKSGRSHLMNPSCFNVANQNIRNSLVIHASDAISLK